MQTDVSHPCSHIKEKYIHTKKVTKPPDAKLPMITIMEINLPIVYAFDLSTQELRFSHFPFHKEIIFAAV